MVHDVVECRYAAHANEEKRAFPDEKFRYRFGCEEHGLFYGRTAFNQRSIFLLMTHFSFRADDTPALGPWVRERPKPTTTRNLLEKETNSKTQFY